MEDSQVRVLLVDGEEKDCVWTRKLLSQAGGRRFVLEWIPGYDGALETMRRNAHDVYLLDYRLGERTGLELLREAIYDGCKAPMIMLTPQSDSTIDTEAIKAGAADSLVKDQINATLLERSIRYAIGRKRADERMAYLAQYDPLTGLVNRSLFKELLSLAIARAERNGGHLALMFLDLDRFKVINDSLGHDGGDHVLKIIADRIRGRVRKCDTVARFGGDEFTVLLEGIHTAHDAGFVAQQLIDIISLPITVNDQELFVTTSIGISVYPQSGKDLEPLIKNADMAMYRAKRQGRNTFRFYTTETHGKASRALTLDTALRRALDRKEFMLHFQPQVAMATGAIIGIEALLRWVHPERGIIQPEEFIPLAEENGMIVPIGEWVLGEACRQNKAWQEAGCLPVSIGVNLSARQFRQKSFVQMVECILRKTGLSAKCLELELTESLLFESNGASSTRLTELKELGVNISIDDFGTGYSSLSYLKCFPITTLKIDKSFVCDLPHNAEDAAIASGMIALAHGLQVKVTAEGVESRGQLEFLRERACDVIQGFLISPPVSARETEELLKQRTIALP